MKINPPLKQVDVIEVGHGGYQISAIPVTAANKKYLVDSIFSTYLGEKCQYCGKTYKKLDDLKDTVWVGDHKDGRLACKPCWSANHKTDMPIAKRAAS